MKRLLETIRITMAAVAFAEANEPESARDLVKGADARDRCRHCAEAPVTGRVVNRKSIATA